MAMTAPLTLDELREVEQLRLAVDVAAVAWLACRRKRNGADRQRMLDLAQAHDNANLIYHAKLACVAPRLLAAASELHELKSALAHLDQAGCSIDHPNHVGRVVEPVTILQFAKHLGWSPSNGGTDG